VGTDSLPAATAKKSSSDSDLELIARAKEGDQEAFAALFNAHKRRVYSLCLQMTGDVADAEDLTQDAFIQVFRKLATFRGASAFSTWLYRVAVNTALMKLRRRRPQQVSLDEPVCLESSFVQREYSRSDPHLQGTVDRVALVRAIKKLPDGYRTIFILHDIEGHDHREIAQLLHCSIGNSKSQLHKARLKIRELLLTAKSESLAKPPSRKPRVNRAGLATNGDSPSPSSWSAHSITAPKGYAEALLNSWTATGMWGELLHGQRGRVL
jgi:RNA polymerase sigma-70 factor (ECF subfamily)